MTISADCACGPPRRRDRVPRVEMAAALLSRVGGRFRPARPEGRWKRSSLYRDAMVSQWPGIPHPHSPSDHLDIPLFSVRISFDAGRCGVRWLAAAFAKGACSRRPPRPSVETHGSKLPDQKRELAPALHIGSTLTTRPCSYGRARRTSGCWRRSGMIGYSSP